MPISTRRRLNVARCRTASCARSCAGSGAAAREVGWRAAVDSLRPHSHALWQGLDDDEQRRFLRHARPWWDVHRHRIAPEVAATVARMVGDGRLEIVAGRIVAAREFGEGHRGRLSPPRRRACADRDVCLCVQLHRTAAFDRAFEGPAAAQPARSGEVRPDDLGIGLEVDENLPRRRASMGDGAADQGPLLGDHRRAGHSRAGGRKSRTTSQRELGMNRPIMAIPKTATSSSPRRPCEVPDDVAEAVRTLIRWAGDDPDAKGLLDTPRRVARAWQEYARGYAEDPGRSSQPHLRGGRRLRRDRAAEGHSFPVALRASHGADHRQGLDRLSAAATRSSGSASSRACCTALRAGCRCRSG